MKTVIMIAFILICIALIILVMMQEGKSDGLSGAMSGMGNSYWDKNKGRSMEGNLVKWTAAFVVVFLVLTVVLNMAW
ncbi:MAG: preprotein translocase subunit SecG [Lachnospiraceae bacterium]|nr:preprotein translocase subunit SecG [Lachnospiraceae bacterium]